MISSKRSWPGWKTWTRILNVNLEIDDLSPVGGFVARNLDDGVAIAFDMDDYEEERFANEIATSVRGMAFDD